MREGHPPEFYDAVWGRFPPVARFNMDQIPLPFVVCQDTTFTTEDDSHVHIRSCGADGLTKRQYTVHLTSNAGEGENGLCYGDLICRGTGKRISRVEKEGWNPEVGVFFQKCAWVDRPTMVKLAERFCEKKEKLLGKRPAVMFCDNLDAHCCDEVLEVFSKHNVLLIFVPPATTDATQPIDAGIGRSTRIEIGNQLDLWLMSEDNLDKWESGFKAKERRVLMTQLLHASTEAIRRRDDLRKGCFTRTGCLLTVLPDEVEDAKVKPQGLKLPYKMLSALPAPLAIQQVDSATAVNLPESSMRLPARSIDGVVDDSINESVEATASGEVLVVENTTAASTISTLVVEIMGEKEDRIIESVIGAVEYMVEAVGNII